MSANRIQLDGDGYVVEEALCSEAVYPGNILEKTSAGKFQKHSSEGDHALVRVAVEDALQGEVVSDQYASGARVISHIQRSGTRFQALLKAGEDISIGDPLISDGNGRLIAQSSRSSDNATKEVIAWAEEALDLSSSSTDTLIAVRAD